MLSTPKDTHLLTNVEITLAAATKLGYTIKPLHTGDVVIGYYISHKQRGFYIAKRASGAFFPTLPRWQIALTENKIASSLVLHELSYTQITTTIIQVKKSPSLKAIRQQVAIIPLPFIVKPVKGSDGSGIELCRTHTHFDQTAKEFLAAGTDFLIQPFVQKDEYRIMFADGAIRFIHRKKFPEVIGDGKKTIAQLLQSEKYVNKEVIAYECKQHGYTLTTVLPLGLTLITHITKKTDISFYITDQVPPALTTWATQLCHDLNFDILGIDVYIEGEFAQPTRITIIEINSKPGLDYLCKYFHDTQTPIAIASLMLKKYFNPT